MLFSVRQNKLAYRNLKFPETEKLLAISSLLFAIRRRPSAGGTRGAE
jgi:hypothetical protein